MAGMGRHGVAAFPCRGGGPGGLREPAPVAAGPGGASPVARRNAGGPARAGAAGDPRPARLVQPDGQRPAAGRGRPGTDAGGDFARPAHAA
ncbi:hypothetical protein G6F57_021686 [Rhizopus arrhizus]|nr:hypothetical protein G6F57_021686 [Rhizopus arrhizus]